MSKRMSLSERLGRGGRAGRPSAWRHLSAAARCPGKFVVLVPAVWLGIVEVLAWVWPSMQPLGVHPALSLARSPGVVLLVAGLALFVWTNVQFHRANGTLHPTDGPQTLVTTGPYAWTRNPMITGVIAILVGAAILLGSWALAIYTVAFVVAKTVYLKTREEPHLRLRFPGYQQYAQDVPGRWLPWPPRTRRS